MNFTPTFVVLSSLLVLLLFSKWQIWKHKAEMYRRDMLYFRYLYNLELDRSNPVKAKQ